MRTIAVTGATGFVGGQLVRRLVAKGYRVLAFGRRAAPDLVALPGVFYESWDIACDRGAVAGVDGVVHCAGTVTDWGPRPGFMAVNVTGTENVLRAFGGAPRFIHISTASVYDPWAPKCLVREDCPYPARYLNAYSESKMLAEVAVRAARPGAVILRPHAVYGRGDPTLLPRLRRARVLGLQLAIGNGRNRLSITHISNLLDAVMLGLESSAGGTFNVADAATPTLSELLEVFLDAEHRSPATVYIPAWVAWGIGSVSEWAWGAAGRRNPPLITRYAVAQLASEYTLDITRARRGLGYDPQLDYRQGIPDALCVTGRPHALPQGLPRAR